LAILFFQYLRLAARLRAFNFMGAPLDDDWLRCAQIVADADHLESWRLTKAAAVRIFDGETSKATDWLLSFPEIRDLYRLATKVGTEREAKRRGVPSVSPNLVEGLV
jgi:hypothetical protein